MLHETYARIDQLAKEEKAATFTAPRLSKLQRQLWQGYKKDEFSRDQITIARNIHSVQQPMRERIPKMWSEVETRISRFLDQEPKSAGTFFMKDVVMYGTDTKCTSHRFTSTFKMAYRLERFGFCAARIT